MLNLILTAIVCYLIGRSNSAHLEDTIENQKEHILDLQDELVEVRDKHLAEVTLLVNTIKELRDK